MGRTNRYKYKDFQELPGAACNFWLGYQCFAPRSLDRRSHWSPTVWGSNRFERLGSGSYLLVILKRAFWGFRTLTLLPTRPEQVDGATDETNISAILARSLPLHLQSHDVYLFLWISECSRLSLVIRRLDGLFFASQPLA